MTDFIAKLIGQRPAPNPSPAGDRTAHLAGYPLNPGRVVTATVVGPAAGGLTQLKLMGANLLADSAVELIPGQTVKLVVQQTEPQVVFSLAEGPSGQAAVRLPLLLQGVFRGNQALMANLRTLLEFDLAAAELPEGVKQAAAALQKAAARLVAENPDPLRHTIKAAGLNLEARLAAATAGEGLSPTAARGLRPLYMALERAMAAASGRAAGAARRWAGFEAFGRAAHQVGGFFDNLAELNAETLPRDNQLLLALSLAWQDRLESGELLIGLPEPDEQGQRQGQTSLVFFLRLSALGDLAIEARLAGKTLTADFVTDRADKAEFINQRLDELGENLAAMGYRAHLQARVRPSREVAEVSPLATLIREHGQYLSIRV